MIPNSFGHQVDLIELEAFKAKLKKLKKEHANVSKKFNKLCDEIDNHLVDQDYINNIVVNLTIHLSELDIIEKDIKEINEIIQNMILEFSN
jgi:seryl-tRNA synthetase